MNLEFNIAVHVLAFLYHHRSERFNSTTLAQLTCLNPVQLRRVTTQLVELQLIDTTKGKDGGYQAHTDTGDITLATLYQHFVLAKSNKQRLFTGSSDSHCVISRNIAHTMADYQQDTQQLILNHYKGITIKQVITDIQKEETQNESL